MKLSDWKLAWGTLLDSGTPYVDFELLDLLHGLQEHVSNRSIQASRTDKA